VNRQETIDGIMVGLEKTSYIIDRCAVYEFLYLKVETRASRNLEKTLLQLYITILKYLAKAIKSAKSKYSHSTRLYGPN
jgi:hypothetical protein